MGGMDTNLTNWWLMYGTVLVFLMQAGFALLECGSIQSKNVKNVLLKNLLDACAGGIVWWAVGYSFAYGDSEKKNEFIGSRNYFMWSLTQSSADGFYAGWMFQWAFAASAATIVSGAVAERCKFGAYLIYTVVLTGFIYPVVVHWGWSAQGWMSAFHYDKPVLGANGLIDFAGSGIVHMVGGGAALMGAAIIGPRRGRFPNGEVKEIPGHSTALAVLGTLILWFGWYGFNPVSTLAFSGMGTAARVCVTTTLAACSGGLTVCGLGYALTGHVSVEGLCNGILGGLVSITAPCVVVRPYAAFLIGIIGGFVYQGSAALLILLRVDDVVQASPVHFFCGFWGVASVGIFAVDELIMDAGYVSPHDEGFLYGRGGKQLGVQLLCALCIALWTCGVSGILFFGLKAVDMLRIDADTEDRGLDDSHHGGSAYTFSKDEAKKDGLDI